jgi:hypothetical protein
MMMNGGVFHHYFNSKKTTHVIAANLPDTKVRAVEMSFGCVLIIVTLYNPGEGAEG